MKLTEEATEEIKTRLVQLGLKTCQICGSESLSIDRRPVCMIVGGTENLRDSTTNMIFLSRVFCEVCGHSIFFENEKFVKSDDDIYERE